MRKHCIIIFMERKKRIRKTILIIVSAVLIVCALVGIELLLNQAYRNARISSDEAFDRTELEAVALQNVPQIKTEKSNFAASVLWATKFYNVAKDLTEEKIIEEVGDGMGEYELYAALDKYMPGWKREQVRNLKDAEVLEKLHESLSKNRAVLATAEDGKGDARYVIVTAFDPVNRTVAIYDLELGAVVKMTETEFLKSLKLENVGADTKTKIFFGKITPNALMTVH